MITAEMIAEAIQATDPDWNIDTDAYEPRKGHVCAFNEPGDIQVSSLDLTALAAQLNKLALAS